MYGVIDIGSNTMRLNIYEYTDKQLNLMISKKITAGLAGYVNKKGDLTKKGIDKAITSLREFKMILDHIDLKDSYTFATASLRNINNSEEATKNIEKKSGFDIDILSGEEEATFGYLGASMILSLKDGLLIDIGGGSTELVLYEHGEITNASSLPIGSLSLYNKYVTEFLPTEKEMLRIRNDVLSKLRALDDEITANNIDLICGVGGTVRAARKLNNEVGKYEDNNNTIKITDLHQIFNDYILKRHKFVKKLIKVAPDRLHTIIPGMLILETVASYYSNEIIEVSDFGVREGYLYNMISKDND